MFGQNKRSLSKEKKEKQPFQKKSEKVAPKTDNSVPDLIVKVRTVTGRLTSMCLDFHPCGFLFFRRVMSKDASFSAAFTTSSKVNL